MSTSDTARLIDRARQGDREAVTALYRPYVQQIYRYIAYRIGDSADAEDLTAEVFLKMVEALPNYQPTGAPFAAWVVRIASARVIEFYRRTPRRPQAELGDHLLDTGPLPEERLHDQGEIQALRSALKSLSPEDQTVLILRFVENRSHREVAELMGRSEAAVRMAQHRALNRLAEELGSAEKVRHYLRGRND